MLFFNINFLFKLLIHFNSNNIIAEKLKLIKLTLIKMAFVFRGERKTETKKEPNPGPGSYEFIIQK